MCIAEGVVSDGPRVVDVKEAVKLGIVRWEETPLSSAL
jgi:hypothetical protein